MAHPVGPDWTAGTALMHLAFWDRQWLAKLEEWERAGDVLVPPLRDTINLINDGMLHWWRTFSADYIRHEVVNAAEAMDAKVAALPEVIVKTVMAVRPRTLTRWTHRAEHLVEVEESLRR